MSIMEKNVILMDNRLDGRNTVLSDIVKKMRRPAIWLCTYYSQVLERKLTMRQTWLLVNAQLAFGAAFFPVDMPTAMRIVCMGWVVSALLKCRHEL